MEKNLNEWRNLEIVWLMLCLSSRLHLSDMHDEGESRCLPLDQLLREQTWISSIVKSEKFIYL